MSDTNGGNKNGTSFIAASESLPEITLKAIVLGMLLSAVLAGANAYLGLKVGMTVSASIPAAVISMALLKMFRESNILENNIVQTAASAGESLAAGVIFTLPALVLMGYWTEFSYVETTAIAAFGGILGVLFTVPLRRALIVQANLKFPEGVATAEVLKVGNSGKGDGIKVIGLAAAGAALVKLAQTGFKVLSGSVGGAVTANRSIFGYGSDLSLALLGVGFIVGLNIATLVFAGGLISWLFGIPIYSAIYGAPEALTGYDAAITIWSQKIRFLGVGAMVVGGLWALVSLFGPIRDGVKSSLSAVRSAKSGQTPAVLRTERDMPITMVGWGTLALSVPIFVIFNMVVQQAELGIGSGLYWSTIAFGVVFALFAGFLFSSVAGYMAGLVGSSNNPLSGVTIASILLVSLILLMLLGSQIDFSIDDGRAMTAAATAILVGAVVCCAAAIAGDNMQDLKAGYLLGATPQKQQIMQVIGVVAGAIAIAPILQLLFSAYGLADVFPRAGMNPEEALQAPQATLMASVATGVFSRDLPWGLIAIGGAIAVAIIAFDEWLKARGSSFRSPVLAVAVGIYLPLELSVPIFIGGLVAYAVTRAVKHRGEAAVQAAEQRGLLFSSGLITGEALLGIILAIPFAAAQTTDVLRIPMGNMGWLADWLGILVFACFVLWLYRISARAKSPAQGS